MRIRQIFSCYLIGNISLFFLLSAATSAHSSNQEIKRTVLAIFDSSEPYNSAEDNNLIHKNAEMVLNYLGMKVQYHDIQSGLPDNVDMENIHGILTWFHDDQMPNAAAYLKWLLTQMNLGKKVVVLGSLGAFRDSETRKDIPMNYTNKVFNKLGLDYQGDWSDNPFIIEIVSGVSHMVEFERTLEHELEYYEKVVSLNKENNVYLSIRRSDLSNSESSVVVTTPTGAFALKGYEIFIQMESDEMRWRINPFHFFTEGFGLQGWPRLDTTTVNGRRIFYSHIDGDGIRNISYIDSVRYSGEVIYEDILTKYKLPITVSFIMAEINAEFLGTERIEVLAKKIAKLSNVEVGSHSFTHPLDWENLMTSFKIKAYSNKSAENDSYEGLYPNAFKVTVDHETFLNKETQYAIQFMDQNIMPKNKKVVIQHWSGNCEPQAEAIDLTKEIEVKNINGGDSRLDSLSPTYTSIAPLTRPVNGRVQFYTSNANENIYTDGWIGNFYSFGNVLETFKQTEVPTLIDSIPRRVTPMNIYYHFFSGERKPALDALKKAYDYVLDQEMAPLFTSQYVSVVEGFLSGKMQMLKDGGWGFSDYGLCRTVRFDKQEQYPDFKRSQGIIGFKRWNDSLYVHLDESNKVILYFSVHKPKDPFLSSASAIIDNYTVSKENVQFETDVIGISKYHFINLLPDTKYKLKVHNLTKNFISEKIVQSNRKGELSVEIDMTGHIKVTIYKKA